MAPEPSDQSSIEQDPTDLGYILQSLRVDGKPPHVYFQAPGDEGMQYPAILVDRDDMVIQHADNAFYRSQTGYLITVIDRAFKSPFRLAVARLPGVRFERAYKANNLYHDVFHVNY